MTFCGPKCKKLSFFVIATLFLTLGILLITLWDIIFTSVVKNQLVLTNTSTSYKMWKETPIPILFEIYMFNWTNSAEVLKNWKVKPVLEQCGPYSFSEHHVRVNLKWHPNDTITYQQKRIWKFLPEKSNGSLDDEIINLNPVAATVGYFVKDKNYFFRKAVDVLLQEKERTLAIKKKVRHLLYEGYDDELLQIMTKMNISKIPFDKFGWFYMRNGSETYDGTFTMYTGKSDINLLGLFEDWNGAPYSKYYDSYCSYINGTSGELWPPILDYESVSMFVPDTCSSISIDYDGIEEYLGVEGRRYVARESVFDNGTAYPDMACFSINQVVPSGTRDVSKCKFGAPAFMSYPHFYLADPSYRNRVVGMKPNKDEHEMRITLEPTTGIPLDVKAQLQLNLLVDPVPNVQLFQNVERTFMPMLWFRQSARLTPELADQAKVLLTLPAVFQYTGYGILALGVLFIVIMLFITLKDGWKGSDTQNLLHSQ